MAGFKIDFSEEDLKAEGSSAKYDPVPAGDYICVVSDAKIAEVKSGDNKGKLMLKVELTVEDEANPFNNRKFFPNIMLFTVYDKQTGKPNNFYMAQWLKATGFAGALETGVVPEPEEFKGKKLIANVLRKKKSYGVDPGAPAEYENTVKGFQPLNDDNVKAGKAKRTNNLLP